MLSKYFIFIDHRTWFLCSRRPQVPRHWIPEENRPNGKRRLCVQSGGRSPERAVAIPPDPRRKAAAHSTAQKTISSCLFAFPSSYKMFISRVRPTGGHLLLKIANRNFQQVIQQRIHNSGNCPSEYFSIETCLVSSIRKSDRTNRNLTMSTAYFWFILLLLFKVIEMKNIKYWQVYLKIWFSKQPLINTFYQMYNYLLHKMYIRH